MHYARTFLHAGGIMAVRDFYEEVAEKFIEKLKE